MGRHDAGATPTGVGADAPMRKFVRIIGTRLGKYVEFEFSVNDADLAVELILPFEAFDEFCACRTRPFCRRTRLSPVNLSSLPGVRASPAC